MIKKFFTLASGEEFLGVIRPSLWLLTPRMLASLVLIGFPFLFWQSLLSLGLVFGAGLGVVALVAGTVSLRDVRRQYLENGVYVTSERIIDVHAHRRSFRVTELTWKQVKKVTAPRRGFSGLLGYGAIMVQGTDDAEFSLLVTPVWRPELVLNALPQVYSHHV
jgi:hypothetical protein